MSLAPDAGPGPPLTLGPMRDEDREAIERRTDELVAEAPELSPEALDRLRRLTNPPKTPRPKRKPRRSRGPLSGEPPTPADGS